MIISFIVAVDESNGMGKNNQLPWHMPADFKMFKRTTTGHHIIMGRKTFESLGKPLPNRPNIIITHNPNYQAEGAIVTNSLEEAVDLAKHNNETEAFIIGGSEIFKQAFPMADRLYLTRIHHTFDVDTWFPDFDEEQWKIVSNEHYGPDEKNPFAYTFLILEKVKE